MGQSICLTLITNVKVAKYKNKSVAQAQATEVINTKFPTDLSLFDFLENEHEYRWTLKPEVLEQDFLPFLEKFYPSFYRNEDAINEYQTVLEDLRKKPNIENWLMLARMKYKFCYQYGNYCEPDRLRNHKDRAESRVEVDYEGIILAVAGNVYLETYGGFLHYFSESIQMRFSEFSLAKCLKVHISV